MAIRGNDVSSPLVIEETDDQFNQFTSSVIVQVEGELLIFIGTGNGELLKVVNYSGKTYCEELLHIYIYPNAWADQRIRQEFKSVIAG